MNCYYCKAGKLANMRSLLSVFFKKKNTIPGITGDFVPFHPYPYKAGNTPKEGIRHKPTSANAVVFRTFIKGKSEKFC